MAEIENFGHSIGIEIAPVRFSVLEVSVTGEVARKTEIERGASPLEDGVAALADHVRTEFGTNRTVGIAVPGSVDHANQRVALSTWLPELANVDFGRAFSDAGLKAVIENDANAAAYAEYRIGAGRGSSSLFYAGLGQGIGGAFIHDGMIWRGANGFAGELGDVVVDVENVRLEDVASSANIVRRSRTRFHQDSTSVLSRLNEDEITFRDILNAANQGDDLARLMLERTGTCVGTAIAAVINILNVETVVIGGEMVHSGTYVLDAIIESVKQRSFGPSFAAARIVAGEITQNASAIGAALLAGA